MRLLAVLAFIALSACSSQPAEPVPIDQLLGHWVTDGRQPGVSYSVVLNVSRDGAHPISGAPRGDLVVTVDIPGRNQYGLTTTDVRYANNRLRFKMEVEQSDFDGLLLSSGLLMRGRFRYEDGTAQNITLRKVVR